MIDSSYLANNVSDLEEFESVEALDLRMKNLFSEGF
jgi:hypothetical protein